MTQSGRCRRTVELGRGQQFGPKQATSIVSSMNAAFIEWAAVRPDNLIDDSKVTEYEVHPSPIRSAIFDSGLTSRVNVGHFMAELITDDDTWSEWNGKMPVIYNKELDAALVEST